MVFLINHIDAQHVTERSFYIEIITGHVNTLGAATIIYTPVLAKMPVPRTGSCGSLYVTVMIAMFTKYLRPICHQYARTYYQKQPRHTRDAIFVIHVQNVEGRVNLDLCHGHGYLC